VTPKVACPNCQFEFFVGDIEVAECPNCGAEVSVGGADS
jgi:DNA-directed RNA polymerase subunit RPC12/RpoP